MLPVVPSSTVLRPFDLHTHILFSARVRSSCVAQPHGLIRAAFSIYTGLLDPPSLALVYGRC